MNLFRRGLRSGFKVATAPVNLVGKVLGLSPSSAPVIDIPQRDTENADGRAQTVADGKDVYKWKHEGISYASLIKGLPAPEFPRLDWMQNLVDVLIRIVFNNLANVGAFQLESPANILKTQQEYAADIFALLATFTTKVVTLQLSEADMGDLFNRAVEIASVEQYGEAKSLQDHKNLFRAIPIDKVAEADQFLRDDIFGWYRVGGPNPMRITKLTDSVATHFPELTDDILKGISGFGSDSLAAMQSEGRLYFVNYSELEGVPTGDMEGETKPGFVYGARCLLAVPLGAKAEARLTVLPLAIRCGQDTSLPLFTANGTHTDALTWQSAKLIVQVSDSLLHEITYHFARTHLLVGLFICATKRALDSEHPLHRLLRCHFYGTAFINWGALIALINTGGMIDGITSPSIDWTKEAAAEAVNGTSFQFNEWFPDVELRNRGVMDASLKFPYRDDALEHWEALLEFATAFVERYYKSDADVQGDVELAAWCSELVEPEKGNLHGFGETSDGRIMTVGYLSRVVAMVIFTASVQHAAVNFPQGTMMQFSPSMPLGLNGEAPKSIDKKYSSLDEFIVDMAPNLYRSEKQLITAEAIGTMIFGKYGDYGRELLFAGEEVETALLKFQWQLSKIGARIQARNETERLAGLPVYKHLVPMNIPPSINI